MLVGDSISPMSAGNGDLASAWDVDVTKDIFLSDFAPAAAGVATAGVAAQSEGGRVTPPRAERGYHTPLSQHCATTIHC
jgi:hypothetical protein